MLSYEDRRRLAAIEQQLIIDDPALARRFANHRSAAQVSRRVVVLVLGSMCVLATSVGFLPAEVLLVFLATAAGAAARKTSRTSAPPGLMSLSPGVARTVSIAPGARRNRLIRDMFSPV